MALIIAPVCSLNDVCVRYQVTPQFNMPQPLLWCLVLWPRQLIIIAAPPIDDPYWLFVEGGGAGCYKKLITKRVLAQYNLNCYNSGKYN